MFCLSVQGTKKNEKLCRIAIYIFFRCKKNFEQAILRPIWTASTGTPGIPCWSPKVFSPPPISSPTWNWSTFSRSIPTWDHCKSHSAGWLWISSNSWHFSSSSYLLSRAVRKSQSLSDQSSGSFGLFGLYWWGMACQPTYFTLGQNSIFVQYFSCMCTFIGQLFQWKNQLFVYF